MEKFENEDVQRSNDNECSKSKDWGTKLGEVVGTVLVACATAAVIALTTKFIFWLF